jgi:hypothetical protein
MFIIRTKGLESGEPHWVVMKTTAGPLMVAFAKAEDAQFYLAATGAAAHCEAVSREMLRVQGLSWHEQVPRALLFPSRDVLLSFLTDREKFPYEKFVADISRDDWQAAADPGPGRGSAGARLTAFLGGLSWNRRLSGLVALIYLGLGCATGDMEGVFKLGLYLILPMTCIWFAEAMGGYRGLAGSISITEASPGLIVCILGWMLLLMPVVFVIIAYAES